jgi:hypothetical protein
MAMPWKSKNTILPPSMLFNCFLHPCHMDGHVAIMKISKIIDMPNRELMITKAYNSSSS